MTYTNTKLCIQHRVAILCRQRTGLSHHNHITRGTPSNSADKLSKYSLTITGGTLARLLFIFCHIRFARNSLFIFIKTTRIRNQSQAKSEKRGPPIGADLQPSHHEFLFFGCQIRLASLTFNTLLQVSV